MNRLTKRTESGAITSNAFTSALLKKLAKYEDAEENGLLMYSFCKAGQTVYFADNEFYFVVVPVKISEIIFSELNIVQYNGCLFDYNGDPVQDYEFDSADFGKTVFLTEEAAEQALKKLQEVTDDYTKRNT